MANTKTKKSNRGGRRPGAGRPRGIHNICTTITLPIAELNELRARAENAGLTPSRYISRELGLSHSQQNATFPPFNIMDELKVADPTRGKIKTYGKKSPPKKK